MRPRYVLLTALVAAGGGFIVGRSEPASDTRVAQEPISPDRSAEDEQHRDRSAEDEQHRAPQGPCECRSERVATADCRARLSICMALQMRPVERPRASVRGDDVGEVGEEERLRTDLAPLLRHTTVEFEDGTKIHLPIPPDAADPTP